MAVVQHTDWEKKQLKSIKLLLNQACQAIDYFVEKDKALRDADSDEDSEEDGSEDWLKFRGIVLDLYSVLDYVWYLLYCHFSNSGQRDLSEKGCELGFPYKKKGIKTSEKPEHDQKSKFVKDKLKLIWGDKYGKETHFWREIGETILSLQPKLPVDNSGAPIGKLQIQPGDEESFALLHFYRNCAAHKDLITFMSKESWLEINQRTRETRPVTERRDNHEGYYYRHIDKAGLWIQLPGSIPEPSRFLIDVLTQLKDFVVSTANRLLQSALLLASEQSILECHRDGFKASQDQQEANITATIPTQALTKTGKTYRVVLNELKQKLEKLNMMVTINYNGPHEVEQQYYETELSLTVTRRSDNKEVLQISSAKHKRIGKSESKEAAAQQVVEECEKREIIRLS